MIHLGKFTYLLLKNFQLHVRRGEVTIKVQAALSHSDAFRIAC